LSWCFQKSIKIKLQNLLILYLSIFFPSQPDQLSFPTQVASQAAGFVSAQSRRPSSLSRGPSFPSPGPARPISRPSLPLGFWPSSPSPPSFLSVTAWLVRCVLHRGPAHSHATSPLRALPHPPAWPWCPRACAPCLTYCMHLRTARTLAPP
jgi:hypothetical protein